MVPAAVGVGLGRPPTTRARARPPRVLVSSSWAQFLGSGPRLRTRHKARRALALRYEPISVVPPRTHHLSAGVQPRFPAAPTAQRRCEPAWHRRARRARGNARALLRVASAAQLLRDHHSAQRLPVSPMPNAAASSKGQRGVAAIPGKGGKGGGAGGGPLPSDWACHLCGCRDNRDWRRRCRRCEALRDDDLEKQLSGGRPTLAERQLQQQKGPSQQQQQRRKDEAERRSLREEVAKLRELVAKQSPPPRAEEVQGDEGGGDEADDGALFASWSEEERAKRLDLAKGGLSYAEAAHGTDSAEASRCRDEIAALQRASREAKPFRAHRAQLERRRDRLRAQQERDEETIAKTQEQVKELQGKVEALQATVAERAKTIAGVSEELTELVRKALLEADADGEGTVGPPPWAQEQNPWSAMAAAIRGLAGQPGMPAELAALLGHVQQVAAAMSPAAAATKPLQQTSAAGSSAAASTDGPSVVLTPHARWGKTAPAGVPAPATPKPTPPQGGVDGRSGGVAAVGAAGGGGATAENGGGGSETTAAAASSDPTAAAAAPIAAGAAALSAQSTAAAPGNGDSEPELLEAKPADDDPMGVDVESSLALLPERDQRRLRAAIRSGGGRGRGRKDDDADDARRAERERSPRPAKNKDGEL